MTSSPKLAPMSEATIDDAAHFITDEHGLRHTGLTLAASVPGATVGNIMDRMGPVVAADRSPRCPASQTMSGSAGHA